ncbi:MAG: GerW family sporulation protein [Nitrososphaerales archaeon]
MSSVTDDVRTTVGELVKAVTAEHTMSEPIEIGDNVVITINRMGLGFGIGKGGTKVGQGNQGEGSGIGGVAGVAPQAVLVIHKSTIGPGGVEVKSLTPTSGMAKAITDIASTVVQGMSDRSKKNGDQTQEDKPKQ